MLKLIRKEDIKTSAWSGGTTTQLAIWPENAEYAARNFIWRVSTARVEAEESEFTPLPGVARHLMILEGELEISHQGHYSKVLKKFRQDSFSGDWKTTSKGRVTDFNLMLTSGSGSIDVCEVNPGKQIELSLMPAIEDWKYVSEVFYFLSEAGLITDTGENRTLRQGDVLLSNRLREDQKASICISNPIDQNTIIIRTVIYHND